MTTAAITDPTATLIKGTTAPTRLSKLSDAEAGARSGSLRWCSVAMLWSPLFSTSRAR